MPRRPTELQILAPLFAALAAASLLAQDTSPRSTGQIEGSLERSTGQVEAAYLPPMPAATPLELAVDQPSTVREGKASAAAPVLFVFTPPAERMIEIRTSSPDSSVALSIFRGEAAAPEPGTESSSRAIGWISGTGAGEELRVLTWTASPAEVPFRLLVRVHPPEPNSD